MSQYKVPDPYDKIECPYDKTHMVDAKRFQRHLQKCGKQHPNARVKKCPYNARHVIAEQSYRHHITTCPDRATLLPDIKYQQKKEQEGERFQGDCSVPAYTGWQPPTAGENWDDEVDDSRVFFYGQNHHTEEDFYDDEESDAQYVPVGMAPQEPPKSNKQNQGPSKIFEYSLQAARVNHSTEAGGVGGWNSVPSAQPRTAAPNPWAPPSLDKMSRNQENIAILQALGRGRGRGQAILDNSNTSGYVGSTSQTSWTDLPAQGRGRQRPGAAEARAPEPPCSTDYNHSSIASVTEGSAAAASSALASQLQQKAVGRGRPPPTARQVSNNPAFSLGRGRGLADTMGATFDTPCGTGTEPLSKSQGREAHGIPQQSMGRNQQGGGVAQQPFQGGSQVPSSSTQRPAGVNQPSSLSKSVAAIGRAGPRPGGRPVNVANARGFSLGGRGAIQSSAAQPSPPQPVFIVPKVTGPSIPPGFHPSAVNNTKDIHKPDVGSDGETISESASQTSTEGASDSNNELPSPNLLAQKEIRKLQKKLREIESLEDQQKNGIQLQLEQEAKISKKQTVVSMLEELSLQG